MCQHHPIISFSEGLRHHRLVQNKLYMAVPKLFCGFFFLPSVHTFQPFNVNTVSDVSVLFVCCRVPRSPGSVGRLAAHPAAAQGLQHPLLLHHVQVCCFTASLFCWLRPCFKQILKGKITFHVLPISILNFLFLRDVYTSPKNKAERNYISKKCLFFLQFC